MPGKIVFNTDVENSVDKPRRIFVSDSAVDASAFCTGLGAGTSVVLIMHEVSCKRFG